LGTANTCVDGFLPSTTICRAAADECDVAESCTGDSTLCPADGFQPDGTECTADDNRCTSDACVEGQCVPGPFNPECGICRTAGFWGNRGGSGNPPAANYTQAVIDAGTCLEVCGQTICGTDGVTDDSGGLLSIGSALEALCITNNDTDKRRQVYRQMVTAALNCVVSGAGDDCSALLDPILVGIALDGKDWDACNLACAAGWNATTEPILKQCLSQLDCFNNGFQWIDLDGNGPKGLGCAQGTCSVDHKPCNGQAAACSTLIANNICVIDGCHNRSLCDSPIAGELTGLTCPGESLGPTSSVEECRTAQRNACSITTLAGCTNPNNHCATACAPDEEE